MSRIGKKEIVLPAGVELTVSPENVVTVKGPKGTLTQEVDKAITINKNENVVNLTRDSDIGTIRAKHGLYRALIANMVEGVSQGFVKELVINGVGYKAQVQGNKLVMNLGLSHPVEVEAEEGVAFECPTATEIKVSGIDKQLVGQVAAKIRSLRKVEPYHEYGIKYKGERVVRKVGKAAGKGKK
ncbi:MAG: 50S ribosomal protein L6 [Clostridia bacterium]|nr:50S ribosomal protein L6 [Clostridia bacterium]